MESKPTFTHNVEDTSAVVGTSATFSCEFQAQPVATSTWYANNVQLTASDKYEISTAETSADLTINNLSKDDSDMSYQCKIANTLATVSSRMGRVTVTCK